LATTEGDRLVDKRDRAILMLFIAYGLRASEVGGLRLDNLD
jgi:integrase